MAPLVLDRHRPTLPELLKGLPRRAQVALAVVAALAAGGMAALLLGGGDGDRAFVHRDAPQFNFVYAPDLRPEAPQGEEYVRLVRRRGATFLTSFSVEPLRLPAYRGDAGGILPIVADARMDGLRARHDGFRLVQEGKTRINKVPGYTIVFEWREDGRRMFGREVLLPEPRPGARTGILISMLATYAAGVSKAEDVGVRGVVKRPYRSLRFGTERP